MKLKIAVSGWAILIPSLVLNIALLAGTLFFLGQIDSFYRQASAQAAFLHAAKHPTEATPRLAVRGPVGTDSALGTTDGAAR